MSRCTDKPWNQVRRLTPRSSSMSVIDPWSAGVSPGGDPAPGGPTGSQGGRGSEERLRGPEEPGVRQGHRQQQGGAEELRRCARLAAPPQENNRQWSPWARHRYVWSGFIKACVHYVLFVWDFYIILFLLRCYEKQTVAMYNRLLLWRTDCCYV